MHSGHIAHLVEVAEFVIHCALGLQLRHLVQKYIGELRIVQVKKVIRERAYEPSLYEWRIIFDLRHRFAKNQWFHKGLVSFVTVLRGS
jgi:hypothetical protein